MKSELLSQEKNVVTIKVTVDKADFAAQIKKAYADIARKVTIPGFRKGKAPRKVIEMRFGKEAIMGQALEDMVPGLLDEVCSEYDLEPIAPPEFNVETMKEDEDLVFTVAYEVEPEVVLPELSEISVDLPVFDVTDAMVEDAFQNLKKRFSTYTKVDRAAAAGDKVRAAYSMKVQDEKGEVVASHDAQIDTFEIDPMAMRPEIVTALTGASAGDKKTAEIKVDENYQDATVAGKMAHYEFDVLEVQEAVAPAMDDEFFKKASPKEVHSEEELRAVIREGLDARLKADARTAAENEAVAKITEAATVEVPETMITRQKDHLRKQFEENVKQRTKMTLEEYYKTEGHDMKEFEENLEKDAQRDVRGYLVVEACGRQLGVSVEKEDLDSEIAQMAAQYGISADSIKDMLKKRPEDFQNMISSARYRKTLAAIMGKVKVNEVRKGSEAPAAE